MPDTPRHKTQPTWIIPSILGGYLLTNLCIFGGHWLAQIPLDGSDGKELEAIHRWHYFSELAFFYSGIALLLAAIPGLVIAYRHAKHVERQTEIANQHTLEGIRARQATSYERLYETMLSDKVFKGFRLMKEINAAYSGLRPIDQIGLAKFANVEMQRWSISDPDNEEITLRLLSTVENIGLLVRRQYATIDDVYYIFEGPMREIDLFWRVYLERSRQESSDQRACEHALWLLDKLSHHVPQEGGLLP